MSYSILVDVDKCTGCQSCVAACKLAYSLSPGVFRLRVESVEEGTFPNVSLLNVQRRCMHCLDPVCVEVCPTGALNKTKEGPVLHDPSLCIGCRYCVEVCPYGAIQFDAEKGIIEKCSMCYDRVVEGLLPLCVEVCPSGALTFGTRDELLAAAKKEGRYVWGEREGGGTSVILLSNTPFEKLGLPREIPSKLTKLRMVVKPLGWGVVGAALLGIVAHLAFWRARRMKEVKAVEQGE